MLVVPVAPPAVASARVVLPPAGDVGVAAASGIGVGAGTTRASPAPLLVLAAAAAAAAAHAVHLREAAGFLRWLLEKQPAGWSLLQAAHSMLLVYGGVLSLKPRGARGWLHQPRDRANRLLLLDETSCVIMIIFAPRRRPTGPAPTPEPTTQPRTMAQRNAAGTPMPPFRRPPARLATLALGWAIVCFLASYANANPDAATPDGGVVTVVSSDPAPVIGRETAARFGVLGGFETGNVIKASAVPVPLMHTHTPLMRMPGRPC